MSFPASYLTSVIVTIGDSSQWNVFLADNPLTSCCNFLGAGSNVWQYGRKSLKVDS